MESSVPARSKTGVFLLILLIFMLAAGWYWSWRDQAVSTSPAVCIAKNLRIHIGKSDGTAGTVYRHVVITNEGTRACQLAGYPTAFLLNSSHTVIGSGSLANPLYTPSMIVLAAGSSAHSVLGFPEAGNFDSGVCTAVSSYLRLYLPGIATPLETMFASANCPGFGATAIVAGT